MLKLTIEYLFRQLVLTYDKLMTNITGIVKFAASDVILENLCQRLSLVEYFEPKITDNKNDDFLRTLSKNDLPFPEKILESRISPTYKRLMKIL